MKPEQSPSDLEIIARLREIGLDRLKIDDVLDALRDQGVDDLKSLVARTLAGATSSRVRPRPNDLFWQDERPREPAPEPGAHRPIKAPFTLNGVHYDAKDLKRFDGQTLHYVYATSTSGEPYLEAYTGGAWLGALHTYFQVRHVLSRFDIQPQDWFPPPEPPPLPYYPLEPWKNPQTPSPPPPPPRDAQFFSDINFKGDWFWLAPGFTWPDLTEVDRGTVLFWSGDWNDVISSLDTHEGAVVLFEHTQRRGASITFKAHESVPNLVPLGWNDRVSSIQNFG